jgi:hypothetical protein
MYLFLLTPTIFPLSVPVSSSFFFYFYFFFGQIRLTEQENQLRAEWDENQRQLIEQNHVTGRRLNDAEAKYAALQACK